MPDILDTNGLQISSLSEIVTVLTTSFLSIYGSDINLDSNSPDGQTINIYAQVGVDQRELLLDIYNMFFVENAYGVNLTNLVSLNGIARRQATYTTTPVNVTVDRALSLYGQDTVDPTLSIFTLLDLAGNKWQLVASHNFASAGTAAINFACITPGAVEVEANTIDEQFTSILGVTAVNNPTTTGTTLGTDEESDAQLKIRRGRSFYLASTGPAKAIEAQLLAVADITDAKVYENNTAGVVSTIPAHSIWCIVRGGTAPEITTAIYTKKSPGCGMKGSVSGYVSASGTTVYWDTAVALNLHIKFTVTPKNVGQTFDDAAMKAALVSVLVYKLGQVATIGDIVVALNAYNSDILPSSLGVSINGTDWYDSVSPTALLNYFLLDAARITIS